MTMIGVAPAVLEMQRRILALAPHRLTLLELRRRVRGRGTDRLAINFVGRRFDVSPVFGCAIETLAFSGQVRLVPCRGNRIYVTPGRNYERATV